jgi:hypothetical protein
MSSLACMAAGGCATPPAAAPVDAPRVIVPADGGRLITSAELDELTRAFADRYVGLLYSASEAVKDGNPDPVQRREAQALLADCSSNIYDIASNADAFTRLLDMVVITRLMRQVWVDDGRAATLFGDRARPLADAMVHACAETQALAARVLTSEQLRVLESLVVDWRKENSELVHTSFVRFSNFAIGRGRSAASEVLAAQGFFAEVGKTGQQVDEARLLAERVFYLAKRAPTLLRWQVATTKDELLSTPEVTAALADVGRLTDQVEQLPAHVAAEREALLAAFDSRMAKADATLAGLKEVVAESRSLIDSLEPASKSVDRLLKTADTLFKRYDEWDRWAVGTNRQPFEIRDYTELVEESAVTAQRLNETIASLGDLLDSTAWRTRIDDLRNTADGRIDLVAAKSQLLMDRFFQRVYIALGAAFALLLCYRVISILLMRRFAPQARAPRRGRSDTAPG